MQTVTITSRDTSIAIGHRIECADTSITRLIGLLGKRTLCAGEGLWIKPSSGVHTFGMRFAIDVVGLDRDMRVVKLWSRVKPQRITCISTRVRSVLELAAGEIEARSLQIGTLLSATPSNK
jgi:uncharacterized membrane protein (UPF0127 family)